LKYSNCELKAVLLIAKIIINTSTPLLGEGDKA